MEETQPTSKNDSRYDPMALDSSSWIGNMLCYISVQSFTRNMQSFGFSKTEKENDSCVETWQDYLQWKGIQIFKSPTQGGICVAL